MPIGADEVTVLDHTGGYTMFANLGKAQTPHAVLEVRSGAGELIWRWDRDGKKPVQAIPPQVAVDMVGMMTKVVEEGTARRATLDGIRAAGKTGTTNAYRDAWFVGYTGNFVCGVWFGNDDYKPMHQMTGGSLPAQTWHEIMAYAHQGIELKPIPGLGPQAPSARPVVAENKKDKESDAPAPASRPNSILTKRGADALIRVERLMDDATRELVARSEPTKSSDNMTARPQGTVASASDSQAPSQSRGD
jgi:penicillin-binding protein 1A